MPLFQLTKPSSKGGKFIALFKGGLITHKTIAISATIVKVHLTDEDAFSTVSLLPLFTSGLMTHETKPLNGKSIGISEWWGSCVYGTLE